MAGTALQPLCYDAPKMSLFVCSLYCLSVKVSPSAWPSLQRATPYIRITRADDFFYYSKRWDSSKYDGSERVPIIVLSGNVRSPCEIKR